MRIFAQSRTQFSSPYPEGQRSMLESEVFAVGAEPVHMKWEPDEVAVPGELRMRISVASDVREVVRIAAMNASDGTVLGVFDLRFSYVLQIHEISIPVCHAGELLRSGVVLKMIEGTRPQWLFWSVRGSNGHRPHLFVPTVVEDRQSVAFQRLCSLDSLQPFGWLEGCVLDGLLAWSDHMQRGPIAKDAIRDHLRCFTGLGGSLFYENPKNLPADNGVYGAEGCLPFAVLARMDPGSPWLPIGEDFFTRWVAAGSTWHVAETSYTCAYAMAALNSIRPGIGWGDRAIAHLLRQQAALVTTEGIWLRRSEDASRQAFLNWSRGVAWYLLGLARSLPLLPPHFALISEFIRASRWILQYQRNDGLWGVFVHEQESLPDTSGSAGIAAALAIGVAQGWLPPDCRRSSLKCRQALESYITDDGFLTGVAQSNKGGEELQRGPLRVMAQFGLGLYLLLLRHLQEQD